MIHFRLWNHHINKKQPRKANPSISATRELTIHIVTLTLYSSPFHNSLGMCLHKQPAFTPSANKAFCTNKNLFQKLLLCALISENQGLLSQVFPLIESNLFGFSKLRLLHVSIQQGIAICKDIVIQGLSHSLWYCDDFPHFLVTCLDCSSSVSVNFPFSVVVFV